ncbi:hypothetical protein EGT74_12670 [Chitinophaga lutea]|uniref:Uncharacterized protein n=1 Tax=Chitinophaga lutea TaxID=2488634 RepID=A0A3N4PJD8_9BACT|nr:hypothetical protein EGT74_12670 [Chitinophaga lutea]
MKYNISKTVLHSCGRHSCFNACAVFTYDKRMLNRPSVNRNPLLVNSAPATATGFFIFVG